MTTQPSIDHDMNAAIAQSVTQNTIVTLDYTEARRDTLAGLCDDSVDARSSYSVYEFWGCDDDGNDWRVHLHDARHDAVGRVVERPTFDDVSELPPGVYCADRLNPPSGDDCTHLLVRRDGSLGWCDAEGAPSEDAGGDLSRFSVADLCDEED